MKKIIRGLTAKDHGKKVIYTDPNTGEEEVGIIKGFSNEKQIAWVVYNYNNKPEDYQKYTGVSTEYSNLTFK